MSKVLTRNPQITAHHAAHCPSWCALPDDHAAAVEPDTDGLRYVRHIGPVLADGGGRTLDLEQTAVLDAEDAIVEQEPAQVLLDGDALHGLDVDQARHLAAALALAAELAAGGVR